MVGLLAGCGGPAPIVAHVVDVFDNPIEGAEVIVEGHPERLVSDGHGVFHLPAGLTTAVVRAGREGFIPEEATLDLSRPAVVRLYPRPEKSGFYLVGATSYVALSPVAVEAVGTELEQVRGVRTVGDASTTGGRPEILFHTDLKLDQVMRVGLGLHQLSYTAETEMAGPFAETRVPVRLWTSSGELPLDVEPMRSRQDYLLTSTASLGPGPYAIDTQSLLDGGERAALDNVPLPLRVAYPFELR
jgi:hypothetical protein